MQVLILGPFLFSLYFHPLEVVGRGSETQLQVGEKLIYGYSLMVETN